MAENIFRHNKLIVYKDALEFTRKIRLFSRDLPKLEDFCLKSQIIRAADSVVLNIAEGSDRYTNKDFCRFLNQAIASLSETVACLDICLASKYTAKKEYEELIKEAEVLYKKLNSLYSKIKTT